MRQILFIDKPQEIIRRLRFTKLNTSEPQDATLERVTKHHINEEDRIATNYHRGKEAIFFSPFNVSYEKLIYNCVDTDSIRLCGYINVSGISKRGLYLRQFEWNVITDDGF